MSWRDDAACKGMPLSVFFPDVPNYASAKAVCDRCDVRRQCLEMALRFEDRLDADGMFGGLTPAERADIRYRRWRR